MDREGGGGGGSGRVLDGAVCVLSEFVRMNRYAADLLVVFWLLQLMGPCSCHSRSQVIAAHVSLIEVSTEHDLQPQFAGLCARKAVMVRVRVSLLFL